MRSDGTDETGARLTVEVTLEEQSGAEAAFYRSSCRTVDGFDVAGDDDDGRSRGTGRLPSASTGVSDYERFAAGIDTIGRASPMRSRSSGTTIVSLDVVTD